ncbi:hypothetical protein E3N88_46217 [Mikania micrantha]|uniref:MULE transposase domain-containing protein n=1 Tax=Mikania micrantha TaxID=192012 RepID=A0A5N6L9A7_9ASTR|nr:hypothetical protein E3N88_46217 [Mikania micrantha]
MSMGGNNFGDEYMCVYETDQVFAGVDELVDWAIARGRENGYVLVRRRSKTNATGVVIKVWLKCDRGGVYHGEPKARRTGSKKTGCEFELIGRYERSCGGWKLRVVNNEHNHLAAEQLGGHPYAMRLNENETRLVEQLSNQNMLPRDILAAVKDQNPENVSNLRNIYNARRKLRIGQNTGETPIQVLFSTLQRNNFIYQTQDDASTDVVEQIFFIHQTSYNIWRAFPHVLLIDTTYKTNKYNMPFVQIVGVTSTHKTFSVAHAFISKEREENFVWVLQNLKDTLQQCMEPRVIVTDRELALINACRRIFPSAAQLLCRWHIFENISKHCRPSFSQSDWQKFGYMWSVVIESATPDIYEYNYSRLHEWLWTSHQRVIGYLQVTWLQKYKEMFVSAWIDKNRNFGQRTTNRVESQHSLLKKSLHATNNTLDNIVGHVIQIVKSQAEAINESFERSKIFRMAHHNDDQFELLKGNISHVALDLLVGEKAKIQIVRDLSGRVDRLEGMMRWMTERMAASAGMDIPVFPGPGHHQDPQDPGGHA